MAKSIYFENCLREIRHSVYGRDNRKPIADAITQIEEEGYIVKQFTEATVEQIENDDYTFVFHFSGE